MVEWFSLGANVVMLAVLVANDRLHRRNFRHLAVEYSRLWFQLLKARCQTERIVAGWKELKELGLVKKGPDENIERPN